MWRFGIAVGFVLVLVLPTASVSDASSHHAAPAKCAPGHSRLITADAQAQVDLRPESLSSGFEGRYVPAAIMGCAYGRGRSYSLGLPYEASATGAGGVRMETLSGPVVAYEVASATGAEDQAQTVSFMVVVRDLRSGRILHEAPTGTPMRIPFAVGVGRIVALVVKSDGAVAWIAKAPTYEGTYQLHALDSTGNRVLASGAELDPSSLAMASRTLYWTQGGKPMSAPLN